MAAATCICGRHFSTRSGATNHGRKCPIEQARSRAFVETIEQGIRGPEAGLAIARAVREAKAAHPDLVVSPAAGPTSEHYRRARRAAAMGHGDPPIEERIARALAALEADVRAEYR